MYTLQIHTCTITENYKEISRKLQHYKTEKLKKKTLVVTSGESEDTGID